MARTVKVTKWGNSLGVRIPLDVAAKYGIKANDRLRVEYTYNQVIYTVRPSRQEQLQAYLDELVASGIHPDE